MYDKAAVAVATIKEIVGAPINIAHMKVGVESHLLVERILDSCDKLVHSDDAVTLSILASKISNASLLQFDYERPVNKFMLRLIKECKKRGLNYHSQLVERMKDATLGSTRIQCYNSITDLLSDYNLIVTGSWLSQSEMEALGPRIELWRVAGTPVNFVITQFINAKEFDPYVGLNTRTLEMMNTTSRLEPPEIPSCCNIIWSHPDDTESPRVIVETLNGKTWRVLGDINGAIDGRKITALVHGFTTRPARYNETLDIRTLYDPTMAVYINDYVAKTQNKQPAQALRTRITNALLGEVTTIPPSADAFYKLITKNMKSILIRCLMMPVSHPEQTLSMAAKIHKIVREFEIGMIGVFNEARDKHIAKLLHQTGLNNQAGGTNGDYFDNSGGVSSNSASMRTLQDIYKNMIKEVLDIIDTGGRLSTYANSLKLYVLEKKYTTGFTY